MPTDGFRNAFAQNASEDMKILLAATQRPINLKCIQEKAPRPLWKDRPSWFLVAENDRMIPAKTQQFEADRMQATAQRHNLDHSPMLTSPETVIRVILDAVRSVFKTD